MPGENPFSDFCRVSVTRQDGDAAAGYSEFKIPANHAPTVRPKPRERLSLGKTLYDQLLPEPDEYDRTGPPETLKDFFPK